MNNIKNRIENWIPKIALTIVTIQPLIDWGINYINFGTCEIKNIYTLWDTHIIFIFCILNLIYDKLNVQKTKYVGDESNILLNRNQSDYYEIWDVCKKNRSVTIEAYGHSFKTLWHNFIKKFLNDAIINPNNYDHIKIRLISTQKNDNCFSDIASFYNTLSPNISQKIKIDFTEVNEISFFTGICVNKEYLWLSIREPYSINKINEHVREWQRKNNITSEKMIEWFLGIIEYYFNTYNVHSLY